MATNPADDRRPVRVLLIDDDEDDYLLTRDLLADIPGGRYRPRLGRRPTTPGWRPICRGEHDVYLLDYRLGAQTGLELLARGPTPRVRRPGDPADRPGRVARSTWRRCRPGPPTTWRRPGSTPPLLERSIRYALQQQRYEAELERKVQRADRAELARRRTPAPAGRRDRPQGRVPGDARPRAAQPARPDPQRPGDHAAGRRQPARRSSGPRAMMERQVGQMVRLIDDLLDVSRITRGKLQLMTEPVDLKEVIEAAVEMSRPQIEKAGLKLSVSTPDGPRSGSPATGSGWPRCSRTCSTTRRSTPSRAGRSISPPGSPTREWWSGSATPASASRRRCCRSVFELFTQVDRSLNRSQGGLGIGLALVRGWWRCTAGRWQRTATGSARGPSSSCAFRPSRPDARAVFPPFNPNDPASLPQPGLQRRALPRPSLALGLRKTSLPTTQYRPMSPVVSKLEWQRALTTLAAVAVFVVVVAALYWARSIFIPVALAIFLTFVLSPVVAWLQRRRFGRLPAVLATVGLAVFLVAARRLAGRLADGRAGRDPAQLHREHQAEGGGGPGVVLGNGEAGSADDRRDQRRITQSPTAERSIGVRSARPEVRAATTTAGIRRGRGRGGVIAT